MDPAKEDEAQAERTWLVERRSAMTATDAPAIWGLSPFSSPIKVWRSKLDDSEDKADSEAMFYGRLFERPILQAYEKRTSHALVYPDPFKLVRSPQVPLIAATLDAQRQSDGAPVDAKNVGYRTEIYGEEGTDDFPLNYAAQLMVQMFVTGARTADLAVLFSRYDFRVYTLNYDDVTAEGLISRMLDWHKKYVEGNLAPPVDGTADYTAFLKRIKQATQMVIRADPEQEKWALELKVTKEQLEAIEMEKDRLQNLLKSAIGEARGIEGPKWRALWSQTKDSVKTDWEAAFGDLATVVRRIASMTGDVGTEDDIAKLIATHTETKSGYRRFLITYKE